MIHYDPSSILSNTYSVDQTNSTFRKGESKMDSISAAFIAVLNADIDGPIKDTYNVLKGALYRKYGGYSYIAGAVKLLESKPDFISRQVMLKEAVRITKAQKETGHELWHLIFVNNGVKLIISGSPVL
jgi:hypothetical protein